MNSGYLSFNDLEELSKQDQPISFDYESILLECKESLQKAVNSESSLPKIEVKSLPKSDPLIKLVEILAYRELLVWQRIKEGVQACRLTSAQDNDLLRLSNLFLENVEEVRSNPKQEIIEQPKRIHTAGTVSGYRYFTRDALSPLENEDLVDMKVDSLETGVVRIVLLFDRRLFVNGTEHTEEDLQSIRQQYVDKIKKRLLSKEIRPIGHKIEIQEVVPQPYHIKARLGVDNSPGAAEVRNAAEKEVRKYIDERYGFGTTVYRTGVFSALQQAGVSYIILDSLTGDPEKSDIEAGPDNAPLCGSIEVEIDTKVPDQLIQSAYLKQTEGSKERDLSCRLLIGPPKNETRITHYIVYWGSDSGKKISGLSPLAMTSDGGDKLIKMVDVRIPDKAFTLVIHTANQNGEMEQGYAVKLPTSNEGVERL